MNLNFMHFPKYYPKTTTSDKKIIIHSDFNAYFIIKREIWRICQRVWCEKKIKFLLTSIFRMNNYNYVWINDVNFDILYNWDVCPLSRRHTCPQSVLAFRSAFSDAKVAPIQKI